MFPTPVIRGFVQVGRSLTSRRLSSVSRILSNAIKCRSRRSPQQLCQRGFFTSIGDKFNLSSLPLLIMPITATALGTWQIFRWRKKLQLIAEIEEAQTFPAVRIPKRLEDLDDMEWKRVVAHGFFDHNREMYVGPRGFVHNEKEAKRVGRDLIKLEGQVGYQVITPFLCTDNGKRFLVNRGWVPQARKDPEKRLRGQAQDEVEIECIVRMGDKQPNALVENDETANVWVWKDLEGMAHRGNCEPYIMDVCLNSDTRGGPIGGQTILQLYNKHVEYIITWYALAFFGFLMIYNHAKKGQSRSAQRAGKTVKRHVEDMSPHRMQLESPLKGGGQSGSSPGESSV